MSTTQPIRNAHKLQEFKEYYLTKHPQIRNYTLCILGLNTALRISDILKLKWGDVYDFSKNCFLSHMVIAEQKTGKNNIVILNASVLKALAGYMLSMEKPLSGQTYIFRSRKGENHPIGRGQAFMIIKEAAKAVGLGEHISCHSLRKTFGYHAWKQGTSPVLLMNIYNHSSYQITRRYLGIEQDDKDDVFRKIFL